MDRRVRLLPRLGGIIGGASVAGAEWRAGTVGTVLTWEPRRTRLLTARMGAAVILAAAIATLLQLLSLVLLLPAVLVNGTTAGADTGWWLALAAALVRASTLTALAALLALSIANIGRNTTAALAAIAGWLLVGEGLVRGLKPQWAAPPPRREPRHCAHLGAARGRPRNPQSRPSPRHTARLHRHSRHRLDRHLPTPRPRGLNRRVRREEPPFALTRML